MRTLVIIGVISVVIIALFVILVVTLILVLTKDKKKNVPPIQSGVNMYASMNNQTVPNQGNQLYYSNFNQNGVSYAAQPINYQQNADDRGDGDTSVLNSDFNETF